MGGPIVRGNHDRACSGLTDLSDFNLVAAMSAYWTKNTLAPDHLQWLRELPPGPCAGRVAGMLSSYTGRRAMKTNIC